MDRASGLKKLFIDIRSNKIFELFVIAVIVISALKGRHRHIPLGPNLTAGPQDSRLCRDNLLPGECSSGWLRTEPEAVFSPRDERIRLRDRDASLIPIDESEMALLGRLLRVFRVLRLVSMIPSFRCS
jgi:voltage-gated sodium channel